MTKKSDLEQMLEQQLNTVKQHIPAYEREYKFLPDRRFRFDFAWPEYRIAVELEGGIYTHGKVIKGRKCTSRHLTVNGFKSDCEKYNLAALAGWRVLRFPAGEVSNWNVVALLVGFFEGADSDES